MIAIHRPALGAMVALLALWSGRVPAAEPTPPPAPLISQTELLERLAREDSGLVVLDVRTAAEFAAGHVPGARNVSHEQLAARIGELAALKDQQLVLYCRSGRRTQLAEQTLRAAGFTRLLHLEGDWLAWQAGQRPVQRPAAVEPAPSDPVPANPVPAN
jgi:phage shock protein E